MAENDTETPQIPKYPPGLKARGKRLWREVHGSANLDGCPETRLVAEEACYLADEVERLRRVVRAAGSDTRVTGYNGQLVTMPEADDLRKNQTIMLSMLKSIRMPDDDGPDGGKMTRSQSGRAAATARWHR